MATTTTRGGIIMSSFNMLARNKKTGWIQQVSCVDDYFGESNYGYIVNLTAMREDEFYKLFEEVGTQKNESTKAQRN